MSDLIPDNAPRRKVLATSAWLRPRPARTEGKVSDPDHDFLSLPGPGRRGPGGRGCRNGSRYNRLKETHQHLLREMKMAEQIQRGLLPRTLPTVPGARFAFSYRPAKHLAGDFLNVVRLDHNRIGLYVGDVMGHGPAAALLSIFTMLTLRLKRIAGDSYEIFPPARVLEQFNHALLEAEIPGQPFVTLVYGILDTSDCSWTYCGGGHPRPMILRGQDPPRYLEPTGPLLGVTEQLPFHENRVVLEEGDQLILYTDGLESANWGAHGGGIDGLISRLRSRPNQPESSLDNRIEDTVAEIQFEEKMADDVAVLATEITPRRYWFGTDMSRGYI